MKKLPGNNMDSLPASESIRGQTGHCPRQWKTKQNVLGHVFGPCSEFLELLEHLVENIP